MKDLKNILLVGISRADCEFENAAVFSVSTGYEAMKLICKYSMDLIVVKWNLKDMPDGLFFKRARSLWLTSVFIAIVEADNCKHELAARQAGADIVVNDDFNTLELNCLINELICYEQAVLKN